MSKGKLDKREVMDNLVSSIKEHGDSIKIDKLFRKYKELGGKKRLIEIQRYAERMKCLENGWI